MLAFSSSFTISTSVSAAGAIPTRCPEEALDAGSRAAQGVTTRPRYERDAAR
jgi:hypothetical protein